MSLRHDTIRYVLVVWRDIHDKTRDNTEDAHRRWTVISCVCARVFYFSYIYISICVCVCVCEREEKGAEDVCDKLVTHDADFRTHISVRRCLVTGRYSAAAAVSIKMIARPLTPPCHRLTSNSVPPFATDYYCSCSCSASLSVRAHPSICGRFCCIRHTPDSRAGPARPDPSAARTDAPCQMNTAATVCHYPSCLGLGTWEHGDEREREQVRRRICM